MSKNDRSWIPDAVDLDWIESLSPPLPPALAAIEAAAQGPGIPIVDRDAGRVLQVLAGDRRRIVEVGTAYGYSTLWMALGQPADGTIVTIDPDRERTDLARGWWRAGRDRRRADHGRQRAGARCHRSRIRRSRVRSTWSSSTRSSPNTRAYLAALSDRSLPGALIAADNVLWSGRVSGTRPAAADDANTAALRAFDTAVLADPRFTSTILPVGDGLLIATWRG